MKRFELIQVLLHVTGCSPTPSLLLIPLAAPATRSHRSVRATAMIGSQGCTSWCYLFEVCPIDAAGTSFEQLTVGQEGRVRALGKRQCKVGRTSLAALLTVAFSAVIKRGLINDHCASRGIA